MSNDNLSDESAESKIRRTEMVAKFKFGAHLRAIAECVENDELPPDMLVRELETAVADLHGRLGIVH